MSQLNQGARPLGSPCIDFASQRVKLIDIDYNRLPYFILPPPLLEALHLRAGGVRHRVQAADPAEAAVRVQAARDAGGTVGMLNGGHHVTPDQFRVCLSGGE